MTVHDKHTFFDRLGLGVVSDFNKLRMESNPKNIATFMPVVAKIVQGFSKLDDKAVSTFNLCALPLF